MHRSSFLAALTLLFVASPALAEGWQMPNLSPFAKRTGPPTSTRISDEESSSWAPSLPKLPSLPSMSGSKKSNEPSTWQKMSSSTKGFFNKTADVLNPFDDANDAAAKRSVTGSNTVFSQASARRGRTKKKSGGMSLLPTWPFGGEEKPQEPETVNSFLARPRPGY